MTRPASRRRVLTAAAAALAALAPLAAATAAVAAPAGVCTGVAGCRTVATRDVDGDGRADQVGLVRRAPRFGEGTVTVRVLPAGGRTLALVVPLSFWAGRPWFGAAPIDGEPGAELVVGRIAGAHFEQFTVVTWRSGRLLQLAPPNRRFGWGVDESFTSNIGLTRRVAGGEVRLVQRVATLRRDDRYRGATRVWRWAGAARGWERVSSRPTGYPTRRAASAVGGWHVRGLPRFA